MLMFALLFPQLFPVEEYVCEIEIIGIKNDRGQFVISAFDSQEGFASETSFRDIVVPKGMVREGKLSCSMKLPEGTYGIALMDDEDSNLKMKFSRFGIPREGIGFSDYEFKGFQKPKLEDFDFRIDEKGKKVLIPMKYF